MKKETEKLLNLFHESGLRIGKWAELVHLLESELREAEEKLQDKEIMSEAAFNHEAEIRQVWRDEFSKVSTHVNFEGLSDNVVKSSNDTNLKAAIRHTDNFVKVYKTRFNIE
jgi:hypothetical protein